jgi:hypothetical protein
MCCQLNATARRSDDPGKTGSVAGRRRGGGAREGGERVSLSLASHAPASTPPPAPQEHLRRAPSGPTTHSRQSSLNSPQSAAGPSRPDSPCPMSRRGPHRRTVLILHRLPAIPRHRQQKRSIWPAGPPAPARPHTHGPLLQAALGAQPEAAASGRPSAPATPGTCRRRSAATSRPPPPRPAPPAAAAARAPSRTPPCRRRSPARPRGPRPGQSRRDAAGRRRRVPGPARGDSEPPLLCREHPVRRRDTSIRRDEGGVDQ